MQVVKAWGLLLDNALMLRAQKPSGGLAEPVIYDLVDVGRQVLSKHATSVWQNVTAAFNASAVDELTEHGRKLLELLDDMDTLLATCRWAKCCVSASLQSSTV